MTIEARMAKLERRCRFQWVLLVALGLGLFAGAMTEEPGSSPFRPIEQLYVRQFVLVDKNAKPRIVMQTRAADSLGVGAVELYVRNTQGHTTVDFSQHDDDSYLFSLRQGAGKKWADPWFTAGYLPSEGSGWKHRPVGAITTSR